MNQQVPKCPVCDSQIWTRHETCQAERDLRIIPDSIAGSSVKDYEWFADDNWQGFGWDCENDHLLDYHKYPEILATLEEISEGW